MRKSPERLHYRRRRSPPTTSKKPTNQNLSLSLSHVYNRRRHTDTRHFFSHSLSSCRAVWVNACHISRFASVLVQLVRSCAAAAPPCPESRTLDRSESVKIHPSKQTEIDWKKKTHIVSDILSKPTKGFLNVNRKHIPIFLFHLLFLFKESDKFFISLLDLLLFASSFMEWRWGRLDTWMTRHN